jgi:hypothetical protein
MLGNADRRNHSFAFAGRAIIGAQIKTNRRVRFEAISVAAPGTRRPDVVDEFELGGSSMAQNSQRF